MKKFAVQRTGGVLHKQVVDGVSAASVAHGAAGGDLGADGVRLVRLDLADVAETDAVFVAKRQAGQQVFERANAPLVQERGALRATPFKYETSVVSAEAMRFLLYHPRHSEDDTCAGPRRARRVNRPSFPRGGICGR